MLDVDKGKINIFIKDLQNKVKKIKYFLSFSIFFVFILCIYFYRLILISTDIKNFSADSIFEVRNDESIKSISNRLYEEGYIKSPLIMRLMLNAREKDNKIVAGLYSFDYPMNLLQVVNKFSRGKYDMPATIVTIPEGFTLEEMADTYDKVFGLNRKDFIDYAQKYNGRLFPETYYFGVNENIQDIVTRMITEFNKRVGEITQDELVLASIVEGEAQTPRDMQIVAGILYSRLKIQMPLQVDVATTTYEVKGIPKEAINNPGLNAINAVKNPIYTKYLYYITGNDAKMYYAVTFKEHKNNIKKYLK